MKKYAFFGDIGSLISAHDIWLNYNVKVTKFRMAHLTKNFEFEGVKFENNFYDIWCEADFETIQKIVKEISPEFFVFKRSAVRATAFKESISKEYHIDLEKEYGKFIFIPKNHYEVDEQNYFAQNIKIESYFAVDCDFTYVPIELKKDISIVRNDKEINFKKGMIGFYIYVEDIKLAEKYIKAGNPSVEEINWNFIVLE